MTDEVHIRRPCLRNDETFLNTPTALGVRDSQEKPNERKNVRGMGDFVVLGTEKFLSRNT